MRLIVVLLTTGCTGLQPLGGDDKGSGGEDTGSDEVSIGGLVATPASLDFGDVGIAETATLDVLLSNSGEEALIVQEPLVTGDFGFEVDITALTFPLELDVDSEQALMLTFSPVDTADYTGELILRVDGLDDNAVIPLTGVGSDDVGGDDGGDDGGTDNGLDFSTTAISFGVIDIGDVAAEPVTITNNTGSDLLITDVVSSDSTVTVSGDITPPQVLSDGDSKTMHVAFAPSQETVTNATVTVTTDAEAAPETEITVSGEGFQPCTVCAPVITVETGGSDSHTVEVSDLGCSASATLVVQNEGDEDLELQDIDYSNDSVSSCGEFSVSWGGATTLAPWETADLTVEYEATEFCLEFAYDSLDQNMLHIYSNDPAETDYAIGLTASVTCLW